MKISEALFAEMEKHALSAPDSEVCGFLYADQYVPLINRSEDPLRFETDPSEVASLLGRFGEPLSLFHTHPNGSLQMSKADMNNFYYPNSTITIGTIKNGRLEVRIYRGDVQEEIK